jgi:hypothetical protein
MAESEGRPGEAPPRSSPGWGDFSPLLLLLLPCHPPAAMPSPTSTTDLLEHELAGLAALGAKLSRLTDRTRWQHDVALGPRASGPLAPGSAAGPS